MEYAYTSLRSLMFQRNIKRKRISSYDKSGGNKDFIQIKAGESKVLADIEGPGAIVHIWMTFRSNEKHFLRLGILRMWWDEEENPSVEVPIGDFFGGGHCKTENFVSLPIQMSPENGKGFNLWFPMPFKKRAVISIENQNFSQDLTVYYYIDYELWPEFPENTLYFHSQWRREIAKGKSEEDIVKEIISGPESAFGISSGFIMNDVFQFGGENRTGESNYVILEAEGKGHYVGCFLFIHNRREVDLFNWYGEGDDMIFIDGEKWPPSLHGTGTEDYFNMAWCPTQKYSAPYHGLILPGENNWKGYITLYRFHIEDPIYFEKSIKVTIEKGHNNNRYDDYSSTAFWYQTEPHLPFPKILDPILRIPFSD
uniref:DUF2961 domain-containing protein n=1 Tax=Dictyoglomus thermophilum TaxID=14 RepID=A0A7C3MJR8_DICTH